jgi:hypothetical protein
VTTSAVAERTRPARAALAPPEQRGSTEVADRVVERIAACAVAGVDDAYGSARRLLGLRMPGAAAPRVTV